MGKHKLTNIVLHITDACTGHCPHCYACSKEIGYKHANVDTIYQIIDELVKAKIEWVSLMGGDPALHPHIIDIAKRLHQCGIATGLMSNTMDLPVSIEEALKYIDLYETTIHASTASEHDAFCGKYGTYELLIKNLKELSVHNAKIGIAINIIPQTSTSIYDILLSLVEREGLKISYVILQRIIPFGRAKNSSEYLLSRKSIQNAFDDISCVRSQLGIDIAIEDPFPLCAIDEQYRKFMHPCEWGYTKAALNGEGDLTRCGADPRYLLGNILKTSIIEIWETSPILKEFREKNYLPDACRNCEMFDECGGGCPLSYKPDGDTGIDYLMTKYGSRYSSKKMEGNDEQ